MENYCLLSKLELDPKLSNEITRYKQAVTTFYHVIQILDNENLLYSPILYMIDAAEDSNPPRLEEKQWSRP